MHPSTTPNLKQTEAHCSQDGADSLAELRTPSKLDQVMSAFHHLANRVPISQVSELITILREGDPANDRRVQQIVEAERALRLSALSAIGDERVTDYLATRAIADRNPIVANAALRVLHSIDSAAATRIEPLFSVLAKIKETTESHPRGGVKESPHLEELKRFASDPASIPLICRYLEEQWAPSGHGVALLLAESSNAQVVKQILAPKIRSALDILKRSANQKHLGDKEWIESEQTKHLLDYHFVRFPEALSARDPEVRRLLIECIQVTDPSSDLRFALSAIRSLSKYPCAESAGVFWESLQNPMSSESRQRGAASALASALRPESTFASSALAGEIIDSLTRFLTLKPWQAASELASRSPGNPFERLYATCSMAFGDRRKEVTNMKILASLALEHVPAAQNLVIGSLILATNGGRDPFPAHTAAAASFFTHCDARMALHRLGKLSDDDIGLAGALSSAFGHPIELADLSNRTAMKYVRGMFGDKE